MASISLRLTAIAFRPTCRAPASSKPRRDPYINRSVPTTSVSPGDSRRPAAEAATSPRPAKPRKKLAVITTAYYYLSHAYHICGRFLNGYLRNGRMYYPDFGIAGMYVEQTKEGDLSRELARAQVS